MAQPAAVMAGNLWAAGGDELAMGGGWRRAGDGRRVATSWRWAAGGDELAMGGDDDGDGDE